MHRTRELRRLLASRLLEITPGTRIPTVRDLAESLASSRSSVHLAIAQLEREAAVQIDERGRMGATLVGHSVPLLWAAAIDGPFLVAFPLPTTSRIQGLATGVKTMFSRAGLDIHVMYLRDPRERLRALREGRCHVAIMSNLVADELCTGNETVVEPLIQGTYAEEHRVYTAPRPHWDEVREHEAGIRILAPEDLAVVGPRGEPASPYTEVRLTAKDVRAVRERRLKAAAIWAYDNPFFRALSAGISSECQRLGIEVVSSSDYGARPTRMRDAVRYVLSQHPDMLFTIGMDPELAAIAYRPAVEAGVKIVFLSSLPRGYVPGSDCVGVVTGDQYAMSRGAIDMLAEAMDGRGSVGIIYWKGPFQVQNLRDQIAKTVLVRDYPSISIVSEVGAERPDQAEEIARKMIADHPEIGGMFVSVQDAAEGVIAALRAAGRSDVKVTSIDLGPNTLLDMVQGGNIEGLTSELTGEMGATMVREAALAALGKAVPTFTVVNALNITRIAVDRDSTTVRRVARREFAGRAVQLLPTTYPQFVRMFQDGEIQVAIWDIGEEHDLLPPGTTNRPLSREVQAEVGDKPSRAALVTRSDQRFVRAVLQECLDRTELVSVQRDVVEGRRLPEY